ncbi:hypothetical protein LWI29_006392 [Acer saccharum]|uniref:C-JID domain-containing protein n=1 Tax=Acer saccharum TaxID=4024 RepID=A0AA39SL93_ACESA|nr:hypothetical protein LWI29_006392 [Acer saccharum]
MLNKPKERIFRLNGKSFSSMSNLMLLKLSNVDVSEGQIYLPNNLRFLKWHGFPLKTLPSNFPTWNLFELNLCGSQINYLWKGMKDFPKLKTVKLSNSHNLIETPDFTMVPNLEMLDVKGCTKLRKVHESVEVLKSLSVLNLEGCKNLQSFQVFFVLKSLKILNLQGCSKLDKFPENLEELEHLEELDVGGTAITQGVLMAVKKQRRQNLFDICIPGNEIPKWFNCRSDEDTVKIGLPSNWLNDEFMGIAMCAVFKPDHKDLDGRKYVNCCMDIIGNHHQYSSGPRRFTTFKSNHLWLNYVPRELFECGRSLTLESAHLNPYLHPCEYDSTNSVLVSTSTCIHAHFSVTAGFTAAGKRLSSKAGVKSSGIRLVYKRDIECSEDDILLSTDASILYQHHNCSTFAGPNSLIAGRQYMPIVTEYELRRLEYELRRLEYGSKSDYLRCSGSIYGHHE